MKARLLGGKAPAALRTRAAALTVRHRDELIGWLREEVRWVAPLLAPALGREGVASVLVDLGEMAVGPLIEALGDAREVPRRPGCAGVLRTLGGLGGARSPP
jgi:hypothetical protein